LVLSFGGIFATEDDEAFLKENKVTHHVMDRPLVGKMVTNREYVQPQWIVDSLNNLYLLPTQTYRPGQAPPPHLSPFIDNAKEGYIPTRQKEISQLKGEDIHIEEDEEEEESEDEVEAEPVQEQVKDSKVASKHSKVKGDADSSSDEDADDSEAEKEK